MKIREIMSDDVKVINRDASVMEAAKLMQEIDAGSLPVEENGKLIGMVTDRDLTLKILAQGKSADTKVGDCVDEKIKYCYGDDDVEEVASQMGELKIRRMPVMDENKRLIGIVSLGDLAENDEFQRQAIKAYSQIAV